VAYLTVVTMLHRAVGSVCPQVILRQRLLFHALTADLGITHR
jgi:hypothetical protein